jgi:NADH-quinone oxidoreductase subunit N
MGFLLIGIVCNSFLGYQASLIYLFIYIVMNIAFLIVFLNSYNIVSFKALKYFGDFKYLKFTGLTQMFYLTIVIFSMAGIPPFAGFFGKYFLLLEAYNADLLGLVIFALATSLISAYYYIRIIKISFFETTSIDYTVKNFLERLSITTNFNNILNISNINTTAVPLAESFVCVSETDSNLNLP